METKNIYQKLLEAQKEIGAIKKDSDNPFFKSKYFDINAILAVVKPVLNAKGLVLTQALSSRSTQGNSCTGIQTSITDVDSQKQITDFVEIPTIKSQFIKETATYTQLPLNAQEIGSMVTYFRRYALQSILALEAEDDDGNTASGKVFVPEVKGGKITNKPADDAIPF